MLLNAEGGMYLRSLSYTYVCVCVCVCVFVYFLQMTNPQAAHPYLGLLGKLRVPLRVKKFPEFF